MLLDAMMQEFEESECKIPVYHWVSGHRSIGIVYVVAPPTWDDLTHLALSGLVDSSNPLWREGTDLASVAREV